ncbi:SEC14 domain and spectrin repeat-containing protein 1 [Elysia marginata]|uniref:SEC14 domain and spectrin repeat-containing protein 1 n=1 Tax=Elysia marginata TaxID=1093978 RepID=A0AAV4HX25_9GAST|nr:SEC14 domain and spectrin repeat-containing protein 1 [Elysia marginata]
MSSEETKRKGVSVVVDTREGSWANTGIVMDCLQDTAERYLKQTLVVLHERDRRLGQDRPSNAEPKYVTVEQLWHFIDPQQLTLNLGGQMEYQHDSWLRVQLVKRVVQYLTNRVDKLQQLLEDRDRSLNANLQFEEWKRNVKTVVDWVLGPGEKLLASQNDIGDSYEAAEELRRRHEEMEIKCTDTYGQYAELRHTADELGHNTSWPGLDDMRAERDYMDTVCRSFASRLERRRTLLITSVRFHRFAEDFSVSLDELLELLCTDLDAETVEAVEDAMKTLEEKLNVCDKLAGQSLNEGQSLLDEMSRPIKNAFGKDISPDFSRQVKHVNKKLEELQERKMRCDELADVRKLKLQQLLQLRTCERDTDQAIDWINELCDVMVTSHTDMGRSSEEAQDLHNEHRKFEATALGTYDYGKQLLQAALVLRRSLRYEVEPSHERSRRLEEAWRRFSKGTSERANRLTVSAMFLNDSDDLLNSMEEFISACAKPLAGESSIADAVKDLALPKRQIGKDFDKTTQMGQALLDRLALPIILYEGDERRLSIDDEGASETVSNRLRKLDRKMSEVDRFWDELERAETDPNFQPRNQPVFERAPSERRKERSASQRKPKTRNPAEAEERRRRTDPFGIASRHRPRPDSYAGSNNRARGKERSFDETDRLNKSYDAASLSPNSVLSLRHNGYLYPDNNSNTQTSRPGDDNMVQSYHNRQASMPDLSHREMQYAPVVAQEVQNVQASMPNLSYGDQYQEQLQQAPSQVTSQPPSEEQQDQTRDQFEENNNLQDQPDKGRSQSLTSEASEKRLQADDTLPAQEKTMTQIQLAPPQASATSMPTTDSTPLSESDPLYSNQPFQPRRSTNLLDIDWLSPMSDSQSALGDQLNQINDFNTFHHIRPLVYLVYSVYRDWKS